MFVTGYHTALEASNQAELVSALNSGEAEFRGFAYEGAAMALGLLDLSSLRARNRLTDFLKGPADPYTYLAHVGAGWALARWPLPEFGYLQRMDPLLRWLAFDGMGFHEGFFHWQRYMSGQAIPSRIRGYAARAFDQGLGRSLWFIQSCDPARLKQAVLECPESRQNVLNKCWENTTSHCA